LEEVANMKSDPNWISYLHANSWIISPFLTILINFLKSKTDLEFPKFSFEIYFKSEGVIMEKVVTFFKTFLTIFYFNFSRSGRSCLDWSKFEKI
jgi:hypothetical protein